MDQHALVNRQFWDEIAPHHAASDFYAVRKFVGGRDTLGEIELAEVGDVAGKQLVHLQCHIGLDTLSWVRRGADVTGVDFSAESLRIARELAAQTGLPARFVESDVVAAPELLDRTYDVVFTSRGVLMWLGDLHAWATACVRFMRPGGVFYLLDIHPLAMAVVEVDGGLSLRSSYFGNVEPAITNDDGSYAVRDVGLTNSETYEWIHPVGDVVSALVRAGITVEFLHEFPADEPHPSIHNRDRTDNPQLPGLFSVRGHL